jgi:transcriptional regulator with XRE-family HTH domain
MNLGSRIRELRKKNGLTQEQLAASLNISAQAVSKWEIGASYPDMTMIPALASLFRVTLDELFDFELKNVEEEIEAIRLEANKYFDDFEKSEKILLDGLKNYPASVLLKTELCELYAYNTDDSDESVSRAFELGGQIIQASQDVFCICRTKANLVHIYEVLQRERGEDHSEEIRKLIETLPYMYPYMIQDRMRLSAHHLRGEEGMKEALKLREIEWQELFLACDRIGYRYYDAGDYENAMKAFQESVDVVERFMIPDKQGYDAYPIGGTHANHAAYVLCIASCLFLLGRIEGIDELIGKAKHIYLDAFEGTDLGQSYDKTMRHMVDYFTQLYAQYRLNEYKPLDLSGVERRITEHGA